MLLERARPRGCLLRGADGAVYLAVVQAGLTCGHGELAERLGIARLKSAVSGPEQALVAVALRLPCHPPGEVADVPRPVCVALRRALGLPLGLRVEVLASDDLRVEQVRLSPAARPAGKPEEKPAD